jgi:hypothetical protein
MTGMVFIFLAACYSCNSDNKTNNTTMGNHEGMSDSTRNHTTKMGYDSMMSNRDTIKQK